jgi:hypothetical protein
MNWECDFLFISQHHGLSNAIAGIHSAGQRPGVASATTLPKWLFSMILMLGSRLD